MRDYQAAPLGGLGLTRTLRLPGVSIGGGSPPAGTTDEARAAATGEGAPPAATDVSAGLAEVKAQLAQFFALVGDNEAAPSQRPDPAAAP